MTCPTCKGAGSARALVSGIRGVSRFCEPRTLPCPTCLGAGTITSAHAARIALGEQMRQDRLARNLSGRAEAERLEVSGLTLNRLEHGREPDDAAEAERVRGVWAGRKGKGE